jgi:hypothetical protein
VLVIGRRAKLPLVEIDPTRPLDRMALRIHPNLFPKTGNPCRSRRKPRRLQRFAVVDVLDHATLTAGAAPGGGPSHVRTESE